MGTQQTKLEPIRYFHNHKNLQMVTDDRCYVTIILFKQKIVLLQPGFKYWFLTLHVSCLTTATCNMVILPQDAPNLDV